MRRTQLGEPPPRSAREAPRPGGVSWFKVVVGLCLATGLLSLAWQSRSRRVLRRAANFKALKRCDPATYPLWQIHELRELDLSDCGHVELPDDAAVWSRFASLRQMNLNGNALRSLPNEMRVLSSLEVLFLSENQFDSVPQVIGELPKLRVLSFRGNSFVEFFSTHLPAHSLVWLILTNNNINHLHENIGELKLLRKLMLSHNQIDNVPAELGECKDLELLRLADNNIRTVPSEILALPKLAWISLSGNPMSKPPRGSAKIIPWNEVNVRGKVLGKGASGIVYQGKYDNKNVAVKMFKEQSQGSDGNAADEAAINGLIDHPLAVSALGVLPSEGGEEGAYQGMVMELISDTHPLGLVPDFDTVARDAGPAPRAERLTPEQVRGVVWNVASVLDYVHSSLGLSHGDVYLHNTLSSKDVVARLSDWGASFVYARDDKDGEGTAASAYERLEVLAFGRLVQDLLAWHLDVVAPDATALDPEGDPAQNPAPRGQDMEDGPFRDLMTAVLRRDPARRPTFREIKETLASMSEFEQFLVQDQYRAILKPNSQGK